VEENIALPLGLKDKLDKQFEKMGGGKGAKECKSYNIHGAIMNKFTRFWYHSNSEPNRPDFVIIHLVK